MGGGEHKCRIYTHRNGQIVSQATRPLQDFSHAWSDEMLYKKYGLSDDEITYIESRIKGV